MAISRETEVLLERSEQLQQRSSDMHERMNVEQEVRQALYESSKKEIERITQEDRDLVLTSRPTS